MKGTAGIWMCKFRSVCIKIEAETKDNEAPNFTLNFE